MNGTGKINQAEIFNMQDVQGIMNNCIRVLEVGTG